MAETTFFVREATTEPGIQQIEALLNQYDGMERVLIDTDDGEIKIQFDDTKITPEHIATALMEQNYLIR
ncbi:heavy-metal-associated domain-containing protein [Oceanobacillus bengalensis]|uniref:Copper chaperone n=1 Tax=Oceanobacillus bengalensis TaxID=1435466 RepID=A0A494YS07_9BACI|nr:heavy-metal-associated domain-containing protein [Oceanobacillus bengalensis]RKQ12446.1 copper chaperone [Oceanobacillus bengalensis]